MDTQICCFILPTTRPEAFFFQPALILTTTYHISPLIILGIQISFIARQLLILASILIIIEKSDNFTYDFKTGIGCMHFKDVFIAENVFLFLRSEQIRFWLFKLVKKKSTQIHSFFFKGETKQVTILLPLVAFCCPPENWHSLN